jgi:16S rRNA (guanine1516-N2)-methyltransferase
MDATVVLAETPDQAEAARLLATRLGLPLALDRPAEGLALLVTPAGLALAPLEAGGPGPLRPDFVEGSFGHRRRQGMSASEPLARATGIHRRGPCAILDATPGLGRDAYLLAALGCQVLACERHPVMAALLADALERAAVDDELASVVGRVTLRNQDARTALTDDPAPDVLVLDPMFPGRTGSALVRKDLRILRRLVGDDADAPELLQLALERVPRVVVRRPAGAPPLESPAAPTHAVAGRRTRLDVYLRS